MRPDFRGKVGFGGVTVKFPMQVKKNHLHVMSPAQNKPSSWCLQPIWKISYRQIGSFTQIGVNIENS